VHVLDAARRLVLVLDGLECVADPSLNRLAGASLAAA
jgi:hypothetical protein